MMVNRRKVLLKIAFNNHFFGRYEFKVPSASDSVLFSALIIWWILLSLLKSAWSCHPVQAEVSFALHMPGLQLNAALLLSLFLSFLLVAHHRTTPFSLLLIIRLIYPPQHFLVTFNVILMKNLVKTVSPEQHNWIQLLTKGPAASHLGLNLIQ